MKKVLIMTIMTTMTFCALVAGNVMAKNGDKCIVDSQCGPRGKCVMNAVGPYGTCAGGY